MVVHEDRIYVAWWPNNLLELERNDRVLEPLESVVLPIDPEQQTSGVVAEDDLLWLASRDGEIVGVDLAEPTRAVDAFAIPFAIHDLAPVFASPGGCPEL
jgi:hypothetical protein